MLFWEKLYKHPWISVYTCLFKRERVQKVERLFVSIGIISFHRLSALRTKPRSGIRDVMWVKEPVQQLGTIAYDRPPVDAGLVTSRDAILGNADAFTAAKNKDYGGARPSRQIYDWLMRSAYSLRCSCDNNNMDCCTLVVLFPNLKSNSDGLREWVLADND